MEGTIYERCVAEYHTIVSANPKIDAGHSVNHVRKVESWTKRALQEYLQMLKQGNHPNLLQFLKDHGLTEDFLQVPNDVVIRVMAASLLH